MREAVNWVSPGSNTFSCIGYTHHGTHILFECVTGFAPPKHHMKRPLSRAGRVDPLQGVLRGEGDIWQCHM